MGVEDGVAGVEFFGLLGGENFATLGAADNFETTHTFPSL
jgi:hypothetical protein